MIKYDLFLSCLIFAIFSLQCSKNSGVDGLQNRSVVLEYIVAAGWTGIVSSIELFDDKSAVKHSNNTTVAIQFTDDEKRDLDTLLSHFPSFKRRYEPQNGAWVDIATHFLIHHHQFGTDTVSILEPLSSEDIPPILRTVVYEFSSKF